ncbi:substrate-binding periplasmic protein [Nitrincola sp. MINF-07-Sa-05]|uniref:substrate-binding periplasmic protein n=1 Tax=Nitrincola salilacus TaxID=3400273 RepID=UPI0039180E13
MEIMPFALSLLLMSSAQAQQPPPVQLITFQLPPLVEASEEGNIQGIAIDLVQRLFDVADVPYELSIQPSRRALESTLNTPGVCAFPVERSQEREALFEWVGPVTISRHGFYSHPDHPKPLLTMEDARGYQIGSFIGSGVGEYLADLGFSVYQTPEPSQGLLMLSHQRIDLWVSDTRAAPAIAEKMNVDLKHSELEFFTTLRSMACHPDTDPETLAHLSQTLLKLFLSGEAESLLRLNL